MHKHKLLYLIVILLTSYNITIAQQKDSITVHRLSLQDALNYAHKNNLQVKNALIDVLAQKQSNREVTAAALPQVSATAGIVDNIALQTQLIPAEFFGGTPGTFEPITFGTRYITTAGINASQLLFDGQVFIGLKARKASINLKQNIADITEETIRTNVYKIYYQLVVGKTQIQLMDSNIALVQKMIHDQQIMYDNGFAEKLDIDKSQVQLTNLQTQREKVAIGIANGYNGLKVLLGMPVQDQIILTDTLSEKMLSEEVLQTANFQYTDRKDYQTLLYTQELNNYNIKRYQFSKLPTLSLSFAASKQAQDNDLSLKTWYTASNLALNLSLPIFKGFATNAKIKEARLALQQTENQIENKRYEIENDIETAKSTYLNAIQTIGFQKKNMALAQSVYDQTKMKYEIGTGSQTEVDNARNDLQTAQTNYYNAMYDAIVARTDFLKAIGKI